VVQERIAQKCSAVCDNSTAQHDANEREKNRNITKARLMRLPTAAVKKDKHVAICASNRINIDRFKLFV